MTCERYRPLLALLVGNDLDPREAAEVRQHMSDCSCCQAQWASLQAAVGALQLVSQQTVIPDSSSLWPQLSRRVKSQPMGASESAPGWLTLGAFAVACVAVLWLTVSTPVFDFDFRDAQFAELDSTQMPAGRSASEQYPQVQLVNDAQPVIPIRMVAPGEDDQTGRVQAAPRLFGGPRSF